MHTKINLFTSPLQIIERAQKGNGKIFYRRLFRAEELESRCKYVEYMVIPTGSSLGLHQHQGDGEEFYYFISGKGHVTLNNESFYVGTGDLCLFKKSDCHAVSNPNKEDLKILMIKVFI